MKGPTRNRESQWDGFDSLEPMSHEEALERNAVEMYILRELADPDEQRFEAHYFECQECARAVAVEQMLTGTAPAREPWWRRLAFPVLTPVAASFMALAAFQTFHSIPRLKAQVAELLAPTANTAITAHPVEKGTLNGEPVRTPSVTVEVTLPPGAAASRYYRVDILGEGRPPLSQVLPEPRGSRLSVHIPSKTLGHGSFNVLVYGLTTPDSQEGPQAGQYRFNIQ